MSNLDITYDDKENYRASSLEPKYEVSAGDANEIKGKHNALVEEFENSLKYKGRYTNLPAIQAAHPNPSDAQYAYNLSGTLRFYALNGTWQSENLSFTPPTAAEQYADTQELVGEQANQVNRAVYEVVDASDDPAVVARSGSSTAYYRYLGVATGDLTAYELLPASSETSNEPQSKLVDDVSFTANRNHFENVVTTPFEIDLTDARENAVTSLIYRGVDPDFDNLENLYGYNGSWSADTDLLLIFRYLGGKVTCEINQLTLSNQVGGYLFITSPTPRKEVNSGDSIDIEVVSANATSLELFYKNISDVWVSIGQATESNNVWTFTGWTPTVNATAIKAVATYSDASTQEVENNLYSLSIYDTFTAANGTLVTARTPDSDLGNGWVIDSGVWEIQSNSLINNSADTLNHVLYHDLGYLDCIFIFKIAAIQSYQAVLRYDSESDYIIVFDNGSGSTIFIQRVAGVNTTLFTLNESAVIDDEIQIWIIDNQLNFVKNNVVLVSMVIPTATTFTKYGFRRGGAANTTRFDDVKIIPLSDQPIDNSVSYTATKLGTLVIAKGFNTPKDDNGIADFDITTVGTTNYLHYAARDSGNNFQGLCLATSNTSDPHNWTAQTDYVLDYGTQSVAGAAIYYDGTTWNLLYTDRTDGKLYHASGSTPNTFTKQGLIKDITSQGLYIRQSSILFVDGLYYVFSDLRYDQPAGEFGFIGVCSGATLQTLGDYREVLSNPGYKDEAFNLTGVSVRYNTTNEYYEMFYSAYKGGDGNGNFPHTINLAISKVVNGKYQRIQSAPLLAAGTTSFDDITVGAPCRLPNTNILYYQYNGTAVAGGLDGLTYATLT